MIQTFEPEVNGWEDLQWHKTQFFFFGGLPIQRNILEFSMAYRKRYSDDKRRFFTTYQFDEAKHLNYFIQFNSPQPSDIVITMTK